MGEVPRGLRDAKAGAIANGVPVHSRPAVGLRTRGLVIGDDGVPRKDRRLEQDPSTAPVVREVFELRAQGEGPAAARPSYLEAAGVTTSQGSKTWSKQAVYGLLSNPVYHGRAALRARRPLRVHGVEEPIVDFATWTAAQHPNGRRLSAALRSLRVAS